MYTPAVGGARARPARALAPSLHLTLPCFRKEGPTVYKTGRGTKSNVYDPTDALL